ARCGAGDGPAGMNTGSSRLQGDGLAALRDARIPAEGVAEPPPEGVGGAGLAVRDEHAPRRELRGAEPGDQLRVVGMRRQSVEADDPGAHRDVLAEQLELGRAVDERAPARPGGLVADE